MVRSVYQCGFNRLFHLLAMSTKGTVINMSDKKCGSSDSRLGSTGGQAVLEGVMMKSREKIAISVRDTKGKIKTEVKPSKPLTAKCGFFRIPFIRGIVGFVDSMMLSFDTLSRSADMLGLDETEEESKFEKWLTKTFGKSIATIASVIGTVLGLALSIVLFMWLPKFISNFVVPTQLVEANYGFAVLKSAIQGVMRIIIFLLYIMLVSLIPDMKRTFMYHGAEHKSIFCHESYEELTVENVKKQSRFHPRCGTSFLVVMMVLGILVSIPFANLRDGIYLVLKLLTLPIIVGLGYEFIRYAGRHDNLFVKIISAPGLWVQRITTKEPTDDMIEVAIRSLKASLPEVYPEITAELEESEKAEESEDMSEEKPETQDSVQEQNDESKENDESN